MSQSASTWICSPRTSQPSRRVAGPFLWEREVDLARFAGLPWCSIATLHSGGETLYRIVGPAICQTSGWALPILWRADDPNAGLKEYEKEVSDLRREWGLEAALSY